jgi:hypothetical protein
VHRQVEKIHILVQKNVMYLRAQLFKA